MTSRGKYLGYETLIRHQAVSRLQQSVGKIARGEEHSRKRWDTAARPLEFFLPAEQDGEDYHGEERLNDSLGSTRDRLLLPYFDIAPSQKVKQFPVYPEFPKLEGSNTGLRLYNQN